MKKYLFLALLFSAFGFSQNGISYQALILNPSGEQLPGQDNPHAPISNKLICLRFSIVDHTNQIEYIENHKITTDAYGIVNLVIGTGERVGGYASTFSDIVWGNNPKSLKVDLDVNAICTYFVEISNQPFTYVPFAYYAANSGSANVQDATTTVKGIIRLGGDLDGVGTTANAPIISNNAIISAKIMNGAVTPIKIEPGSNNTVLVTDNTGTVAWLDSAAFNSAYGAVADMTTIEGAGTVADPFKVKDLGIITSKIANAAVTTSKIASGGNNKVLVTDNTGTVAWLDSAAFNSAYGAVADMTTIEGAGTVADPFKVKDLGIITSKIANAAVTTSKIASGGNNKVLVTDNTGTVAWLDSAAFNSAYGAVADMTTIEGAGTVADPFKVKDLGIITSKIANAAVTTSKIASGGINKVLVTDNTGTVAWLDSAAFNSAYGAVADMTTIEGAGTVADPFKVKDLGIITSKIANAAVTTSKIASGGNNKVLVTDNTGTVAWLDSAAFNSAYGAVADMTTIEGAGTVADPFKVKDLGIITSKIADAAVTTSKIASGGNNKVLVTDNTGTVAWLDSAVFNSAYGAVADMTTIEGAGTVADPFKVKDLGIITSKIADAAVTTSKIADASVTTSKIASGGNNKVLISDSSGNVIWANNISGINSGVSSGVGAPTATNPSSPSAGDIYVDETTGNIYTYNGTSWTNVTTTSTGTGAPTGTTPSNPIAGDIYIDSSTGNIYTYNGTTWINQSGVSSNANNILVNGTDGLAYLSQAAIQGASGVSSGVGAPTATNPSSPSAGDIYVDETTGNIYTYNGTSWTNVTTTSTGTGAPTGTTPSNPIAGDIYIDSSTGNIYTYNGTTWINQSGVSSNANNILVNGTDGLAYLSQAAIQGASGVSSGVGAPTATNPSSPSAGDIYVDETTGNIYTYNGTSWTNVTTTSTGTGAPTGTTPSNPIAGDIYIDSSTGNIYTYNGTTWINQSGVSSNANNILVNGTDGLAYLSQAAIQGASGVSSGVGAPTATNPSSPSAGDIYVDETTGNIYTYNGTSWTNVTTTSTGTGAPTGTTPSNPIAGDIYIDSSTGNIYTYNGTTWINQSGVSSNANNILVNGTDGLAYLSQAAIQGASGVSSGVGAPTATNPSSPSAGDIYVDETTGNIYTYNGTSWTNVTTTSTGTGAPTGTTPSNPIAGDIYIDSSTGNIYTYNGTTWINQSGVSSNANNILVNGTDGLAYLSQAAIQGASGVSSGVGAPTATNPSSPSAGDIYVDETTGNIYTYNGTSWTNVTTTSTGTGAPTGTTPSNPIAGDIYIDSSTGNIYTYNGTTWINQSGVSSNANNILVNGTDGLAYLSQAAIQGASGVSSGVGAPTATNPSSPSAGDIYVDETTGNIYTYNGTSWTNVTTTSTGTGAPTGTTPSNPIAGDIYIDSSTGNIYTYNGTTWINQSGVSSNANNILVNGTDGLAYLSQAAIQGSSGVSSGVGAPTATNPSSPSAGDIYVDETTGNIYTYNGTSWTNVTPAEVDGIIGNEITDAVADGGLTRSGTGTAADPYKLKINDGTANGQILFWDGAKWVAQAATADWALTGNSGTSPATNFIGTTDSQGLAFRTNNTEKMQITSAGNIGIGTATPNSKLQIEGSIATPIIVTNTNLSLDNTHSVIKVDTNSSDITITLPDPTTVNGRTYTIVKTDTSNNKLIFSHSITGSGFVFTQANVTGAYQIQSDGTVWNLVR